MLLQPVKLINFIIILICVVGFVYQVHLIMDHYMLGKTVVNLEVKMMKDQPLPAITIYIPALISIAKLSNSSRLNENSKQLSEDYMKYIEQSKTPNKTT